MKRDDIMDKANNIKLDIVNKVKSKFKLQQYDINEFDTGHLHEIVKPALVAGFVF